MKQIKKVPPIYYVGHRGSRGVGVENTILAFEEGIKRGYPALECDVRITKDGEFVVFHDVDLMRLANRNDHITELTLAELKEITLTQIVKGQVLTGHIPTLKEYLLLCKNHQVRPIIELKWTKGINNNDNSNIHRLIDLIKECGLYYSSTILTSMINTLAYIRRHYLDIDLQFLIGGNITLCAENLEFAFNNNISLDIEYTHITKEVVDLAHSKGLIVNSWTVNSPKEVDRLLAYNVDMITTDELK